MARKRRDSHAFTAYLTASSGDPRHLGRIQRNPTVRLDQFARPARPFLRRRLPTTRNDSGVVGGAPI